MRRVCLLSLCAVGLLVTGAGCKKITGLWVLCEHHPGRAENEFRISKARFYENHAFEAVAFQGAKTIKTKGAYYYEDGTLTMMTDDDVRCYKACLKDNCLTITSFEDCIPSTAVMRRMPTCPTFCPAGACPPVAPLCHPGCMTCCP